MSVKTLTLEEYFGLLAKLPDAYAMRDAAPTIKSIYPPVLPLIVDEKASPSEAGPEILTWKLHKLKYLRKGKTHRAFVWIFIGDIVDESTGVRYDQEDQEAFAEAVFNMVMSNPFTSPKLLEGFAKALEQ